jgi:hypothetical protein
MPISTSLSAQILLDPDELNRMEQPADGSVPILAWLKNAAQILGPRAECRTLGSFPSAACPIPAISTPHVS